MCQSAHAMYEGKNLHYASSDNKPLCSYSGKVCNQRRLNGYGFCVRHILEDKSAPYKQCAYVAKSSNQMCTQAIPVEKDQMYCSNHLIVLGLLPKKEKRPKKEKEVTSTQAENRLSFHDRLKSKISLNKVRPIQEQDTVLEDPDDPYAFPADVSVESQPPKPLNSVVPPSSNCESASKLSQLSPGATRSPSDSSSSVAKLYPELAERVRPKTESKGKGRHSSRSVKELSSKIAQKKLDKSKLRKSQDASLMEMSPSSHGSPDCGSGSLAAPSPGVSSSSVISPLSGPAGMGMSPLPPPPPPPHHYDGAVRSPLPLRGTPVVSNFTSSSSGLHLNHSTVSSQLHSPSSLPPPYPGSSAPLLGEQREASSSKHLLETSPSLKPSSSSSPSVPPPPAPPQSVVRLPPPPPYVPPSHSSPSVPVSSSPVLSSRPRQVKGAAEDKAMWTLFKVDAAVKFAKLSTQQKQYNTHLLGRGLCSSDESESDLEDAELQPALKYWFTPSSDDENNEDEDNEQDDDDNLQDIRTTKLALLRTRLRRQCHQARGSVRGNTALHRLKNKKTLLLVQAARQEPTSAVRALRYLRQKPGAHRRIKKRTAAKKWCCYKNEGDVQCRNPCLPATNHCLRHILYNVDQQLFDYCTAKFPDNTQCCVPVFDILHDFPLCPQHAAKADQQKAQEVEVKKRPRKKTKPPALTRPPKKGKKKKKGRNIRPEIPVPPDAPSEELAVTSGDDREEVKVDEEMPDDVKMTAEPEEAGVSSGEVAAAQPPSMEPLPPVPKPAVVAPTPTPASLEPPPAPVVPFPPSKDTTKAAAEPFKDLVETFEGRSVRSVNAPMSSPSPLISQSHSTSVRVDRSVQQSAAGSVYHPVLSELQQTGHVPRDWTSQGLDATVGCQSKRLPLHVSQVPPGLASTLHGWSGSDGLCRPLQASAAGTGCSPASQRMNRNGESYHSSQTSSHSGSVSASSLQTRKDVSYHLSQASTTYLGSIPASPKLGSIPASPNSGRNAGSSHCLQAFPTHSGSVQPRVPKNSNADSYFLSQASPKLAESYPTRGQQYFLSQASPKLAESYPTRGQQNTKDCFNQPPQALPSYSGIPSSSLEQNRRFLFEQDQKFQAEFQNWVNLSMQKGSHIRECNQSFQPVHTLSGMKRKLSYKHAEHLGHEMPLQLHHPIPSKIRRMDPLTGEQHMSKNNGMQENHLQGTSPYPAVVKTEHEDQFESTSLLTQLLNDEWFRFGGVEGVKVQSDAKYGCASYPNSVNPRIAEPESQLHDHGTAIVRKAGLWPSQNRGSLGHTEHHHCKEEPLSMSTGNKDCLYLQPNCANDALAGQGPNLNSGAHGKTLIDDPNNIQGRIDIDFKYQRPGNQRNVGNIGRGNRHRPPRNANLIPTRQRQNQYRDTPELAQFGNTGSQASLNAGGMAKDQQANLLRKAGFIAQEQGPIQNVGPGGQMEVCSVNPSLWNVNHGESAAMLAPSQILPFPGPVQPPNQQRCTVTTQSLNSDFAPWLQRDATLQQGSKMEHGNNLSWSQAQILGMQVQPSLQTADQPRRLACQQGQVPRDCMPLQSGQLGLGPAVSANSAVPSSAYESYTARSGHVPDQSREFQQHSSLTAADMQLASVPNWLMQQNKNQAPSPGCRRQQGSPLSAMRRPSANQGRVPAPHTRPAGRSGRSSSQVKMQNLHPVNKDPQPGPSCARPLCGTVGTSTQLKPSSSSSLAPHASTAFGSSAAQEVLSHSRQSQVSNILTSGHSSTPSDLPPSSNKRVSCPVVNPSSTAPSHTPTSLSRGTASSTSPSSDAAPAGQKLPPIWTFRQKSLGTMKDTTHLSTMDKRRGDSQMPTTWSSDKGSAVERCMNKRSKQNVDGRERNHIPKVSRANKPASRTNTAAEMELLQCQLSRKEEMSVQPVRSNLDHNVEAGQIQSNTKKPSLETMKDTTHLSTKDKSSDDSQMADLRGQPGHLTRAGLVERSLKENMDRNERSHSLEVRRANKPASHANTTAEMEILPGQSSRKEEMSGHPVKSNLDHNVEAGQSGTDLKTPREPSEEDNPAGEEADGDVKERPSSSLSSSLSDSSLSNVKPPLSPEMESELPLEQASRLLEEGDFQEVFNKLGEDAFGDIFSAMGKNGDFEPTREETEELERQLAVANNDVARVKEVLERLAKSDLSDDINQFADTMLNSASFNLPQGSSYADLNPENSPAMVRNILSTALSLQAQGQQAMSVPGSQDFLRQHPQPVPQPPSLPPPAQSQLPPQQQQQQQQQNFGFVPSQSTMVSLSGINSAVNSVIGSQGVITSISPNGPTLGGSFPVGTGSQSVAVSSAHQRSFPSVPISLPGYPGGLAFGNLPQNVMLPSGSGSLLPNSSRSGVTAGQLGLEPSAPLVAPGLPQQQPPPPLHSGAILGGQIAGPRPGWAAQVNAPGINPAAYQNGFPIRPGYSGGPAMSVNQNTKFVPGGTPQGALGDFAAGKQDSLYPPISHSMGVPVIPPPPTTQGYPNLSQAGSNFSSVPPPYTSS